MCKQVKARLRKASRALKAEVRDLKEENRRLKAAIAELENGDHDIELDGDAQEDMTSVLKECILAGTSWKESETMQQKEKVEPYRI